MESLSEMRAETADMVTMMVSSSLTRAASHNNIWSSERIVISLRLIHNSSTLSFSTGEFSAQNDVQLHLWLVELWFILSPLPLQPSKTM